MNRSLPTLARAFLTAILVGAIAVIASAQAVRSVPRGEITGVDLQIEGRLVAHRGHPMRLALTTFEVLGLDRLRRASLATVRVYTSFARERAAATVTTDERGRALVSLAIPDDAPASFTVLLEAESRSHVVRRFEFSVQVLDARALELEATPNEVFPGSPAQLVGRLVDTRTSRALAGVAVELSLAGPRGPVGTPLRTTTDATGTVRTTRTLPTDAPHGLYTWRASTDGPRALVSTAAFSVVGRTAPPLLVSVAPAQWIVAPNQWVDLDVVARRPDGRPVQGATVTVPTRDAREPGHEATTDARGRARVRYRVTNLRTGLSDESVPVRVERAGIGASTAAVTVRVAADAYAAALSFEGGRFAQSLGGRAFVRVVDAHGRAVGAGVDVHLRGPRLRDDVVARTDASGVAVAELTLRPPSADDETQDACGGTVATEVTAIVGEGEGRGRTTRCLLLDPDGVVRVRVASPRVRGGESLAVRVDRAPSAQRVPAIVELVAIEGGESDPAYATVVANAFLAGTASEVRIDVPNDVSGAMWVRARLLHGAAADELRGAGTAVMVDPSIPFALDARFDREQERVAVRVVGEPGEPVTVHAIALPYEQAMQRDRGFDLGAQRLDPSPRTADALATSDAWLAARLADLVPRDTLAAHATIEGNVVPTPGPEDPETQGRLRDPYRARARFVQGRLALLFRALEAFVDASVPGDEEAVAHLVAGRWVFNDAVLSAIASAGGLGAEGATGLGGEPITIEQLRSIDPSFGFDAVARRVTRKRLFLLLYGLRGFVNERGFDLAWARPGDPRVWIRQLLEDGGSEAPIEPSTLVDGWGRPFQLVPTTRPRFTALQPVAGFELVSAGPDGRFGNGDDLVDPTARVLPSGSTYASAVLEDALVARLRGVELSRSTLGTIGELFGVYSPGVPASEDADAGDGPGGAGAPLPSIVEPDEDALAIRRIGTTIPSIASSPVTSEGAEAGVPLALGTEPRTWGIFVTATTASGRAVTTMVRATSGTSVLSHGELPTRVRVGEPLAIDLGVTNVSSRTRTLAVRTETCGGATIELESGLEVMAERYAPVRASIRASEPGRCPMRVVYEEGGREVASVSRTLEVVSGRHPERRRVTALVDGTDVALDLAAPGGATGVTGRLTVVDPASVVELPELGDLHRRDPALVAWARVATGKGLDDGLRDALVRAFTDPTVRRTSLRTAMAVVALSSRPDDERARTLRDRLVAELGNAGSDAVLASDGDSGRRRMQASVVAALALAGVPDPDDGAVTDPIGAVFGRLVPSLRASVRAEVDSPTELAFAAAALLLADAEDGHGRALFERALTARRDGAHGRLVSAEGHEPAEGVAATFALGLAAHELGRDAEARALIRAGMRQLPVVARAPDDAPFWLVALGVYGALANESSVEVEVAIGGRTSRHRLENGRLVLPVDVDAGGSASVRVRSLGGAVTIAAAEVAYETAFVARHDGPLTLELAGDPGRAYGVAALELTVRSREAVFDPVVELELPASVELDDGLRARLAQSGVVRDVELRSGGFLRLRLAPMGPGSTVAVPLPLVFEARGEVGGLSASAYPETQSYRRTVLPGRVIRLAAE